MCEKQQIFALNSGRVTNNDSETMNQELKCLTKKSSQIALIKELKEYSVIKYEQLKTAVLDNTLYHRTSRNTW